MRRRTLLKALLAMPAGARPTAAAGRRTEPAGGFRAPRYPRVPLVSAASELLANVRHILRRPHLNSRPGYALTGGERVLFVADAYTDPMVTKAFALGFRELGCRVDRILLHAPLRIWHSAEVLELVVRTSHENSRRLWNMRLPYVAGLFEDYDIVIAPDYLTASHVMQGAYAGRALPMVWPTRELLADSSVIRYPEPLLQLIEQKAWGIIRRAARVRITDPEGTDLSLTFHDNHWAVIEGTHPTYRIPGAHQGRSWVPQVAGHLMGVPRYVLPENDAEGIVAGTVDHIGPYPRLELEVKGGRAVRLTGGGRFGDLWREYLEATSGIQYPHHPAPGCNFLMEGAIGTHPKITRPHDVLDASAARSAWHYDRRRAGVLHFGFGQADAGPWAEAQGLPSSHFHVHQYFCTYHVQLRDGGAAVLIDRGRLTALDDPEVRALAARFGDPDELLREAWIPAIPGFNRSGQYVEYARNPEEWIRRDQRAHYGL